MSPRIVMAACALVAACGGGTTNAASGSSVTSAGSGNITVTSNRPTTGNSAGASFSLNVTFTTPSSCTTTKVGACTINPCSGSAKSGNGSVAVPSAGQVTFGGTGGMLDLTPQNDGNYATESVIGQVPWQAGGSALTFTWAHFPGNAAQPGDSITLTSPAYIALAAGSAFAETTGTVSRKQDLTVTWTNDSAPAEVEQVAVDVHSSSVGVYCIFNAAAGQGVMPAAVLASLQTGPGSYSVISKQHASESIDDGDGGWTMSFNINALARTSYGLAEGSVVIE